MCRLASQCQSAMAPQCVGVIRWDSLVMRHSTGAAWLFTIVLSTSQSAFGASQRSTPSPSQPVLLPRRFSAGGPTAVLQFAAGEVGFSKPWPPQEGQAGDQRGQRSHLVESPVGRRRSVPGRELSRARGRRPDQPARAVARGHTEALVASWPRMLLRLWSYCRGPTRVVDLGGFESGLAHQQGVSWRFAALVGFQTEKRKKKKNKQVGR